MWLSMLYQIITRWKKSLFLRDNAVFYFCIKLITWHSFNNQGIGTAYGDLKSFRDGINILFLDFFKVPFYNQSVNWFKIPLMEDI